MEMKTLLQEMIDRKASDLHLVVGQSPVFRIDGRLERGDGPALDEAAMEALLLPLCAKEPADGKALLDSRQDVPIEFQSEGRAYQGLVLHTRGQLAAAIRCALQEPPTLDDLYGENSIFHTLIRSPRGLIVVTGPTGSGKSTTCAAMIETINRTTPARIYTLEDPIDYQFVAKEAVITQRRVGQDVESFVYGIRSAMQSDLDVLLVGELHSLEALSMAMSVAETGHLVLTTMHCDTAPEAVERLIEAFPEPHQYAIRRTLARTLIAVIAQRLVPRADGSGRVPINEILLATPQTRRMIRDGKTDLKLAMEASRDLGMRTMDEAILQLFRDRVISYETAWNNIEEHEHLRVVAE